MDQNEPVVIDPGTLLAQENGDDGFVSPLSDPEGIARAVDKAISGSNSTPDPVPPPDTHVELPGGVVRGDHYINSAEVRELTGEHEEVLARAIQAKTGNMFHFVNALLECGVVRLGQEEESQTKKLLRSILVGDRDALIVGIRRATYGHDIDLKGWVCPSCGDASDLTVPLEDIPVRTLDNPEDSNFELELSKGRKAKIRLANGADQLAVFEQRNMVTAERDSLLLSRCLTALIDPDGTEHVTMGLGMTYARGFNIK